jgi:hypothetical protein
MSSSLPRLYWGVVNPAGEDNHKSTYYFQKFQLPMVAKQLIGKPVKILHHDKFENGENTPPSGFVVHSHVHPTTGKLWAGFVLNPTPVGDLARVFLGENDTLPEELRMQELSLGFDILQDTKTGEPHGHVIKELSICHLGARPDCTIKGSAPYSILLTPKSLPSPKIDQKEISENLNKYFLKNNKKDINKEEKNINKDTKMMKALTIPAASEATRPQKPVENSQTFGSEFNQPFSISPNAQNVTVVSAQASQNASNSPPMDEQQYLNLMQKALETHQQQLSGGKREREPLIDEEVPKEKIQIDFSKYLDVTRQEWVEPPMPEGLNEAQQEAFKQAHAASKELFEQKEALKREQKRKFLERLQNTTDAVIPTWIKFCEQNGQKYDQDTLGRSMAALSEIPQAAEQFASFVEAQAKQNTSNKNLKKDINQLEQEYQAKVQKLTQENEELKKNQARPPLAPQKPITTPQVSNISPFQQQFSLNDLPTIARVYATASLKTNKILEGIPGTQTPIELAIANGLKMQRYFDKYGNGTEDPSMGDLYGETYKKVYLHDNQKIPGVKDDSSWYNPNKY